MNVPVDRDGTFNATITDFGLKEFDSGAVAIGIRATITDIWDPANDLYIPWDYNMEAEGDIWVIKKDGSVNEGGAKSLMISAGWDGDIESITNGSWKPTPCSITVKSETYKDQQRFKIAFVNPLNSPPGGTLSNVSPEKAKAIASRYGSQFRAIAGNVVRNNGAPKGNPPTPPQPARSPAPPAPAATEEKIPF